MHSGVLRLSNTNAHASMDPAFGYHMDGFFAANDSNSGNTTGGDLSIDPIGWGNFTVQDPWGYKYRNHASKWTTAYEGIGAWSLNLFRAGEAFSYTNSPVP